MPERKPYPQIGAQRALGYPAIDSPTVRRETLDGSVMRAVRARICRYRCGTCEYDAVAPWGIHQTHYEGHHAPG